VKIRTAVLSGLTGLMLSAGLSSTASAQPAYRYRDYRNSWMARRGGGEWQAEQMVRQAYRDILRREPDPSGLQSYTDAIVNRGWSEQAVRQSLLNSDEFAQRFGGYRGYRYRGYQRYR
jgi:Domain of unknown function (DUF4214)